MTTRYVYTVSTNFNSCLHIIGENPKIDHRNAKFCLYRSENWEKRASKNVKKKIFNINQNNFPSKLKICAMLCYFCSLHTRRYSNSELIRQKNFFHQEKKRIIHFITSLSQCTQRPFLSLFFLQETFEHRTKWVKLLVKKTYDTYAYSTHIFKVVGAASYDFVYVRVCIREKKEKRDTNGANIVAYI